MRIKQKSPDSLAIEFDIEGTWDDQKNRLCTSPDRMFGYMWYLIRTRLGYSQTIMAYSFNSHYKNKYVNGLSKSAYSKIENGQTYINFDLIFIYSKRFGIHFDQIYTLYSHLLKLAFDNDCIYLEPCGLFTYGKTHGYILRNGVSKYALYTKLKDYSKYFRETDLEKVYIYIDEVFAKAKEAIDYEITFYSQPIDLNNQL